MTVRYEAYAPPVDGAAYQRWLRQRIEKLERQQADRIEIVADVKQKLDDTVERAAREIENLKAQQTIALSPQGDRAMGVAR